jgi:hypothetical protein
MSDPELAGLNLDDDELCRRWPHLCRPGPQPCNQIAPDYDAALRRLRRLPKRRPTSLAVAIRAGRLIARLIRREVEPLAREVVRLRGDLDRLLARRAG